MRALYIAVFLYFVVTLIRPQDLLPQLAVVRPGLLCIAGVIVAWAVHEPKRPLLHDPAFRWQLVLLAVVLIGVVVVVNHRAWLNTLWSYAEYMLVYSVALPTVMQRADYSRNLLRLLLLSFLFLAIWVVIHGGVGTASWMSDENDAAAALIVGACLGYATWVGSTRGLWRSCGLLVAGACVVGVIATHSRGGFLGLVAAVIAMTVFSRMFVRALGIVGLLLALAWPLIPSSYKGEMGSIGNQNDSTRVERLYSWGRAWDMFLANPIIGVGAGNFGWQVNKYEQTEKAIMERQGRRQLGGRAAHSLPFTLISETGAVGSLAFLSAVGIVFRRAWRANRASHTPDDDSVRRVLAVWIGTSLIGFTVASVFISVLWYPEVWLLVGLGIALGPGQTTADSSSGGVPSLGGRGKVPLRRRTTTSRRIHKADSSVREETRL